jgi:hypothetical protein
VGNTFRASFLQTLSTLLERHQSRYVHVWCCTRSTHHRQSPCPIVLTGSHYHSVGGDCTIRITATPSALGHALVTTSCTVGGKKDALGFALSACVKPLSIDLRISHSNQRGGPVTHPDQSLPGESPCPGPTCYAGEIEVGERGCDVGPRGIDFGEFGSLGEPVTACVAVRNRTPVATRVLFWLDGALPSTQGAGETSMTCNAPLRCGDATCCVEAVVGGSGGSVRGGAGGSFMRATARAHGSLMWNSGMRKPKVGRRLVVSPFFCGSVKWEIWSVTAVLYPSSGCGTSWM